MEHRNLSIKINNLDEFSSKDCGPTPGEEEAALEAFLAFFCRPDDRETWASQVARALAETALARLRAGKHRAEFNSANVAEMVGHTVAPEAATSWLSGIWTKIKRRLDEREAGMQDTIRQAGRPYYAWQGRQLAVVAPATALPTRWTSSDCQRLREKPPRYHQAAWLTSVM